ncbi:MAG: DUF4302 domain-containing protein [Mediterranea sp.]|jgi:hypothetical protein|nr:DUF4302 domain-containing protein [Mediterranea sp.]
MNGMKIYGLLAGVCLLAQSCYFSEEDIFDQSSAQRAMASVEECQTALKSASNGWLMAYYPGSEGPVYGGYNLIAKFDGEKVQLSGEMATPNYVAGAVAESLYKVSSFQGTELSFDGYNEVIHHFCEPNSFYDPGYQGDYEFIFRTVSADRIELTGKKYGNTVVMTRLPDGFDGKTYLEAVSALATDAAYARFDVQVNGKILTTFVENGHAFTLSQMDNTGEINETIIPFIYTDKGIQLADTLRYGGVEMTSFSWDSKAITYTCMDNGVDAKLILNVPEDFKKYIGNYMLQTTNNAAIACSLEAKRLGSTYSLKLNRKGVDLELVFTYNANTGCIDLMSQVVAITGSDTYYFYPGYGSNFFPYPGVGFIGELQKDTPMTIGFTYNNNNPSVNTILLLYERSDGWYLLDSFANPVLIKQG